MAYPTQRKLNHRVYTAFASAIPSGLVAGIPMVGRGRVEDIQFVPSVVAATSSTKFIPSISPSGTATSVAMQLNGAATSMFMSSTASAFVVACSVQPNGANTVDYGDVVNISSDGGSANATSGGGTFTVLVREWSA